MLMMPVWLLRHIQLPIYNFVSLAIVWQCFQVFGCPMQAFHSFSCSASESNAHLFLTSTGNYTILILYITFSFSSMIVIYYQSYFFQTLMEQISSSPVVSCLVLQKSLPLPHDRDSPAIFVHVRAGLGVWECQRSSSK